MSADGASAAIAAARAAKARSPHRSRAVLVGERLAASPAASPSSVRAPGYSVRISARARGVMRHREWRGGRGSGRRSPPANGRRLRHGRARRGGRRESATQLFAVVRDGAELAVEALVLRLRAARTCARDWRASDPAGRSERRSRRRQRPGRPSFRESASKRPMSPRRMASGRCAASRAQAIGERQRLRVGLHAFGAADILVAGLEPLRRALVVAAEDEALIGVAARAGVSLQVLEADGDGEIGTERQPLALRPLGHEHSSADVLAGGFEERVGGVQDGDVDEASRRRIRRGRGDGWRARRHQHARPSPRLSSGRGVARDRDAITVSG